MSNTGLAQKELALWALSENWPSTRITKKDLPKISQEELKELVDKRLKMSNFDDLGKNVKGYAVMLYKTQKIMQSDLLHENEQCMQNKKPHKTTTYDAMHNAKNRELNKKLDGGLFATGEKIRADHSQTMNFIDDRLNMSNQNGTNQKSHSNNMANNFDGGFEMDNNINVDPAEYPYNFGGDLIPEADRMANEGDMGFGDNDNGFDLNNNYFLSGHESENKIVNQNAAAKRANDIFDEFLKVDTGRSPIRFDKRRMPDESSKEKDKKTKKKDEGQEKRAKVHVDKDMTGLDMTFMNNTTINPFDNRSILGNSDDVFAPKFQPRAAEEHPPIGRLLNPNAHEVFEKKVVDHLGLIKHSDDVHQKFNSAAKRFRENDRLQSRDRPRFGDGELDHRSASADNNFFQSGQRGLGESGDGGNQPDFDFGNLGLDDGPGGDLFQDGLFNDLDIIMEDSKDVLSDFSSRQGLGLMSDAVELNLPKKKEETLNCLLTELETQETVDFKGFVGRNKDSHAGLHFYNFMMLAGEGKVQVAQGNVLGCGRIDIALAE